MDNSQEKFTWTHKLTMKLIKEAEQRPCLWHKEDKQYANKIYKAVAMEEIAEIVGVSAEAVREKLRNLRINFMQVHKKQLRGGSKAVHPPKWEFYNALLFMAEPTGASPAASPKLTPLRVSKRKLDHDETTTTLDPLSDELNITQDHSIVFKGSNESCGENISSVKGSSEKCNEYISGGKGSNEKFGEYITASLNSLDDVRIVKRTKARIQLLVSEAMTEHAMLKLAECESTAEF
ncbi:uncharacterized protein LOC129241272 [Anastrepha obliqua]|uniref:uncharacterized protein LOC129241272 n=1 Tax=Anastrepha obliqua TaxID=95512 RepID=UPI0024090176|nr:uncharacterized protein LOC129241272 [Anastrepha obliqua]